MQTCELRDYSRAGAGWEVQIIEAGEILVSRRCENEREARYVAEAARKDSLRTGSTADESGGLIWLAASPLVTRLLQPKAV